MTTKHSDRWKTRPLEEDEDIRGLPNIMLTLDDLYEITHDDGVVMVLDKQGRKIAIIDSTESW